MQFKQTYEGAPAKEDIPDFQERIPAEVALELCVFLRENCVQSSDDDT